MGESDRSTGKRMSKQRIAMVVLGIAGIFAILTAAGANGIALLIASAAGGVGLTTSVLVVRYRPQLADSWEVSTAVIVGLALVVTKSGLLFLEVGVIGFITGVLFGGALALPGRVDQ